MSNQSIFLDKFYSSLRILPRNTFSSIDKLESLVKNVKGTAEVTNATPQWVKDAQQTDISKLINFLQDLVSIPHYDYIHPYDVSLSELNDVNSFNVHEGGFCLNVKNVEMYDANKDLTVSFGDFKCFFYFNKVICKPIANNNYNADGYFHPYISNEGTIGTLCLGQYKEGYMAAYRSGRFADAIEIVKAVLTNYGGDELNGSNAGPHVALFMWSGIRCYVCNDIYNLEDAGVNCATSAQPICQECMEDCKDAITNLYHIPELLSVCKKCEQKTTTIIKDICKNCRLEERLNNVSV